MNRAYSILNIKQVNEDLRVIEGIASTPTPDRMGDIVEPLGAQFKLPMPLLWQHDSRAPVGNVTFAKPTKDGIPFKAKIEQTTEPGTLKNRLDEAWQSVKLGLVRAVSIGFTINAYEILKDGGWRINEWEWLELSLVTIPANADATISSIKSVDGPLLVARGLKPKSERLVSAGIKIKDMGDMGEMPSPASDETQQRFMTRCVDHMLNCGDDLSQAEASAHCAIRWDNRMSPQMSAASVSGRKATSPAQLPAASGQKQKSERTVKAGVTASRSTHVVAMEAKTMKKTIAEQIAGFEATRATKSTRMDEIMDAAAEKGETLDTAAKEEHDTLETEIKEIDDHLVRLKRREQSSVSQAVVIRNVETIEDGVAVRDGVKSAARVQVMTKKMLPGIGFTRYVLAMARAKGNIMHALEIAKSNEQWRMETPEVEQIIKAGVAAGGTGSWGASLVNYQILTNEFIEYLRPLTIIGRIQGLTYVPFNVKIQRQTGGSTVGWVGQGAPKPVTSGAFDTVTLDLAKIAGIIVLNDELVRISNPSAETLVRNDLAKAIVSFMDAQFVDPTVAAVTSVSPASITNGVSATLPTGTTGAALRADLKTLLATFLTANMQVTGVNFIMSQRLALAISLMTNSLGQKEFPGISMNGGTLLELPVVTSENVPSTGGSPTDGDPIIVVSAPDILVADDGDVTIDASREASLQMDTAPDSPPTASTVLYSLFQNNGVAIRAERYINWVKRRSTACAYISNGKYFE